MVRNKHYFLFSLIFLFLGEGCGDSEKKHNGSWPDFTITGSDVLIQFDGGTRDLGSGPDLKFDKDGPTITILSPKPDETVVGDVLKVQANITDKQGVDDQSVTVTLQGGTPVRMSITTTPNVYECLLDISALTARGRLWVYAKNLIGKENNSAAVEFNRDSGPKILFLSPEEGSRHKESVSIQAVVADTKTITLFEVKIGNYKLNLNRTNTDPLKQIWVGTINFDAPEFEPHLTDTQVLTATAENANKARSTLQRTFFVDNQGPTIAIISQKAGQLIGKVIQIQAQVTDPAGILFSSVKAVIGNEYDNRTVVLTNATGTPDIYSAQFDTRTLTQFDLWPVISVRAADKLGNESHYDIQVGLDNGAPIAEMDPSPNYYLARKKDKKIECSRPFDPVGADAANDLTMVPQIMDLRAQIKDQGNHVPSAEYFPVAEVDYDTVWMYVLDDTSKALLVDTDNDGYCDEINSEIIPLGSKPTKGEAVPVNLAPITPTGGGNFTEPTEETVNVCENWGSDAEPPEPLCRTTLETVVIDSCYEETYPAIYTIPPIKPGIKSLSCLGLPFDFRANSIEDGWACVAVVADDKLGNRGVSPPLRLWVNKSLNAVGFKPLPSEAVNPPKCTGTLDKNTGKVDATKPCTYRTSTQPFRQRFPAIQKCAIY